MEKRWSSWLLNERFSLYGTYKHAFNSVTSILISRFQPDFSTFLAINCSLETAPISVKYKSIFEKYCRHHCSFHNLISPMQLLLLLVKLMEAAGTAAAPLWLVIQTGVLSLDNVVVAAWMY